MNLTSCYCTPKQPDCDPNTRQVTCDFCNVPTTEIHPRPEVSINYADNHNQTFENPISTTRANPFSSISKNPTLFYAISLPLLVLLLLIFIFIFLLCRRYRNTANALGGSAIGGSGGSSKPKSFLSCPNLFPTLKFCFTRNQSKSDDDQFNANGGVICRFCPLNGTPCAFCGKGFMTTIDGSPSIPQLVHPILGGGWLAEGEIEELSKICTKVRRCSRGRFGEVWLGHMTKVGGDNNGDNADSKTREVAIKVFPEAERKSWETELELYRLPRIKHPNILHFIGIDKVTRDPSEEGDDQDRTSGSSTSGCGPLTEYWLVTDYLAHGSVYDYIHSSELSWGQMLWIAMGMARGLSYLHTELPCTATQYPKPSIAHRDFKSRNVLLKADLTPCISDLGLATRLETGRGFGDAHLQVSKLYALLLSTVEEERIKNCSTCLYSSSCINNTTTHDFTKDQYPILIEFELYKRVKSRPYKVGTARYMAPEVLDGAIQFTRDAFLRIDVYALGLVIWELMTRAHRPGDPIEGTEGNEGANRIPPYMAPFEAELGSNPGMDKLQHYVAKLRNRPRPCPWWINDQ
ncbi:hypothetical protein ACTXT7_013927, partial [Hymenolepis weldensis]